MSLFAASRARWRATDRLIALAGALLVLPPAVPAQKPAAGLKVFISVDMEGIAGVVTADQLGPAGFEYERFRRFMTDEALAAVRAAKAAGATDIVVAVDFIMVAESYQPDLNP